jgi:uncharacterized protein (DUF2147 family)
MLMTLMAMTLAGAGANADSVLGRWQTQTRGGVVEIQKCGSSVCGRILSSEGLRSNPNLTDQNNRDPKLRSRPIKNLLILQGFSVDGAAWNGGTIYNAEDGKTYSARLTPAGPDQLKLRGCVFKPFCRTQTWTRVR